MFSLVPLSSKRLRRRTVVVDRRRYEGIWIFPFFENDGNVEQIVLILPDTTDMLLIDASSDKVEAPLFKPMRIKTGAAVLEKGRLDELGKLWHFDPDWVLNEERFKGHWARAVLRNTNCVDRLPKKAKLYYRRDLSRIQWTTYPKDGEEDHIGKWDAGLLPANPPPLERRSKSAPILRWVLDPIWSRGAARR